MTHAAFICLFLATFASAQEVELRRTLSGPSGHASGATFVFDETRARFVYPQDKSFIVYFEWTVPPGLHAITAIWKTPEGQSTISPEIKVDLADGPLSAYWTFTIHPDDASGVWGLDSGDAGRWRPRRKPQFRIVCSRLPKDRSAAAAQANDR